MKRTSILCVLAMVLLVTLAFPAFGAVELFRVGLANSGTGIIEAPAYIEFTLNCKADITVDILPADSTGVPTGAAAVCTETLTGLAKGPQTYLWGGVTTLGDMAPQGYYVARLTATSVPSVVPDLIDEATGEYLFPDHGTPRWDANIGLFVNYQLPVCKDEYAYRDSVDAIVYPKPTGSDVSETITGFYGIGINKNPNSPFYGRLYAGHQTNKAIYMYDVDGSYIGEMNDDLVSWMGSAPFSLSVADDDYVYVMDRTSMICYCFAPDGSGKVSESPAITNDRGMFARTDATTGITHVFVSSGTSIWQTTVSADHLTWTTPATRASSMGTDLYGFWISPDLLTMWTTAITNYGTGQVPGLRKWTRTSKTGAFTYSGVHYLDGTACKDVTVSDDGQYLWVAAWRGYTAALPCVIKVNAADGTTAATYPIVTWAHRITLDSKGNPVITFGKSSPTYGGKYVGIFAEPAVNTVDRQTDVFHLGEDPAPVVVPGSEWVYTDTYENKLVPDGTDTATVTFKVLDANGFSDIGDIALDLKELKLTSATDTIQAPDTITIDPTNPKVAICTKTVSAVDGTKFGSRPITVSVADAHPAAGVGGGLLQVKVASCKLTGTISHIRSDGIVAGAKMVAVGGKPGVYGYPFTFESTILSDTTGYVETEVAAGDYSVTASKMGYNPQAPQSINVPTIAYASGASQALPSALRLGPITVAQARAYGNLTTYCSVEGVVYAQPKGLAPNLANGMDRRLEKYTDASNNQWNQSFYMCDAGDPENGLLFLLKEADTSFLKTWHDPNAKLPSMPYTSQYIGKRPVNGDTVCVGGYLETKPGYETRLLLDDGLLGLVGPSRYDEIFFNNTDKQPGLFPNQPLPAPVVMTANVIQHAANVGYSNTWGKYGRLENVTVLKWVENGQFTPLQPNSSPADPNKHVLVADSLGRWTTVAFQSLGSMGLDTGVCPVTIGNTYTFTGAVGRQCRQGGGTIRPRSTSDMTLVSSFTDPGANTIGQIRGMASGSVTVRGIVTAKFTDSIYVESADRSAGVKVTQAPWWINVGDDVVVTGNVGVLDGVKQIVPSGAIFAMTTGNALPELGMRSKDVGGKDFGTEGADPGITNGRGPLNVGLYVTLQGMVTFRDSASPFFYVWDGSNMVDSEGLSKPVQDGSGKIGTRIAHNGWVTGAPNYTGGTVNRGLIAHKDFVTIKGVVSVNQAAVAGSTIPQIIPTSITVETAFDTITDAGIDTPKGLLRGSNLLALPAVAAATGTGEVPDPILGVNRMPWDPMKIFAPFSPQDGTNSMFRWENTNASQYRYDISAAEEFGGLLLNDAYWMVQTADWPISYTGKLTTIPQWVAVDSTGSFWVGCPRLTGSINLADIKLSDGGQVRAFADATSRNADPAYRWVQSLGFYWTNFDQSQVSIGLPEDGEVTGILEPWHGYIFNMLKTDKAWIIP